MPGGVPGSWRQCHFLGNTMVLVDKVSKAQPTGARVASNVTLLGAIRGRAGKPVLTKDFCRARMCIAARENY